MIKLNKITVLYCMLLTSICFSQQTLNRNLVFENSFLDYYPKLISVDKVYNYFNGFLVIYIKDRIDLNDKTTYKTKIFWLESMDSLNNYDSYYWYQFFNGGWLNLYNKYDDSLSDYTTSFVEYYTCSNYFYRFECTSYLYSYSDWLTTDILDSTKIWMKDNNNLLVFKTSFWGAITLGLNSRQPNHDLNPYYYKTLIPITKLEYLQQITEKEAKQMNLERSKLVIKVR